MLSVLPGLSIYVQGLLPAVTNLSSQVICNNATLHITWKPPPTLQEVPIITNVINISRFDDGESVNSANTTTGEISEYHYNASNQLGETLVIAVTPVNDLGLGNSTKINIIVPSKYCAHNEYYSIMFSFILSSDMCWFQHNKNEYTN